MSLWTPSQITTAFWFDAADSSTVTTVSNAVSEWRDKSGNARHATQTTAARRPTYTTAGQNSLNIISFSSTSTHWLLLPNSTNPTGANAVFAACRPNNLAASAMIIGRAFNWGSWQLASTSTGSALRYGIGRNGIDEGVANLTGLTNNTNKIVSGIYDNTNVSISVNGGTFTSTPYTQNPTYNSLDSTTIGAFRATDGSLASTFNGTIFEIVGLHTAPTQDTISIVQGYLAWKWGLQADLPNDHPFKTGAPTVGAQRRMINDGLFNRGLFGRSLVR